MSCNSKLIEVIRCLDVIRTTLKTVTQGTVWVIRGDETVNLRKEGLEEICNNLRKAADTLQEVVTENESS